MAMLTAQPHTAFLLTWLAITRVSRRQFNDKICSKNSQNVNNLFKCNKTTTLKLYNIYQYQKLILICTKMVILAPIQYQSNYQWNTDFNQGIVALKLVTLRNSTSSEISFFQVLNDKFVFLQYTP